MGQDTRVASCSRASMPPGGALLAVPLVALVATLGLHPKAEAVQKAAAPQEWAVVGQSGVVQFVYVSPAGLKDKFFVAQLLQALVSKAPTAKAIEILMFDERQSTPRAYPMTDAQMLHQKARYNRNPNTRFEEFVWVAVVNAKTSPPKLKETRASIKPGFAE